jgi:hypothetical protein
MTRTRVSRIVNTIASSRPLAVRPSAAYLGSPRECFESGAIRTGRAADNDDQESGDVSAETSGALVWKRIDVRGRAPSGASLSATINGLSSRVPPELTSRLARTLDAVAYPRALAFS